MSLEILKTLSWRKLGEHTIILDTITNKKVHHLNEMGSLIWDFMTKGKTKEETIEYILSQYNCPYEQASNDYDLFLKKLEEVNVLKP